MVKTLEQIQLEYAVSIGFNDWFDLLKHQLNQGLIHRDYNEVAKRYALENIKADRDKVANYLYKRGATFKDVDGKFETAGDLINENDIPIELP